MFFCHKKECTHSKVSPDKDAAYCPDCGEYIENKWYMTRCSCCNVKRKTIIKFSTVQPESHFCPNCGSDKFYVQRIKNINFIDINFAVLVKEVNKIYSKNRSQSWVEMENNEPIRLLGVNFNFSWLRFVNFLHLFVNIFSLYNLSLADNKNLVKETSKW